MWDKKMSETTDNLCTRAGDLVAYLYGEASETEAQDFMSHTRACAACRAELSAFGDVREAIGAWREQALSPMTSLAAQTNTAPARQAVKVSPERSALAALREFFTLSPMWLRGATAFASLLLVALLVITVMRFFEQTETPVVKQTPSVVPVKEEKPANVPDEKKNYVVEEKMKDNPPTMKAVNSPKRGESAQDKVKASRELTARNKLNQQPKAPVLSKEERSQLSELLIAEKESEDVVPRLYDLLGDTND
jgi:hypothetical protein